MSHAIVIVEAFADGGVLVSSTPQTIGQLFDAISEMRSATMVDFVHAIDAATGVVFYEADSRVAELRYRQTDHVHYCEICGDWMGPDWTMRYQAIFGYQRCLCAGFIDVWARPAAVDEMFQDLPVDAVLDRQVDVRSASRPARRARPG